MKNILVQIVRFLVGTLFIISGLIKLNDPIGFSYKLEEYFSPSVLNLEFFTPYALFIATSVVIFEVVLGVMLLVGYKTKFTLWSLFSMIIFFTFLTFYSAYYNKVTDCGCFGDALKLLPWESFQKDAVLLVLIIILLFNKKCIQPLLSFKFAAIVSFVSVILCLLMAYSVLNHLPFKDFRAYKIGTDIRKGMAIPEGAEKSEYELIFIYKVNNEDIEFSYDQVMKGKIPANAEFVDRKDKLIKQGYVPPIHDFSIEKNDTDYTDSILDEPKVVLFITYNLTKADAEGLQVLESLHQKALAKGYTVIGLTSSNTKISDQIKKQYNHTFDYYFCDATTLKTIERANPSIVILEKGIITQKWHYNDIDNVNLK